MYNECANDPSVRGDHGGGAPSPLVGGREGRDRCGERRFGDEHFGGCVAARPHPNEAFAWRPKLRMAGPTATGTGGGNVPNRGKLPHTAHPVPELRERNIPATAATIASARAIWSVTLRRHGADYQFFENAMTVPANPHDGLFRASRTCCRTSRWSWPTVPSSTNTSVPAKATGCSRLG